MAINDIHSYSTVAASNTDIASANIAEGCAPAGINNALRALTAQLRLAIADQGADKTAAGTTSIAETSTSVYAKITGTTTITSFGAPDGNPIRWIQWGAATPVTHNATSMILKGGVSKTYAAGGVSCFVHEGSGNWRELYDSALTPIGKHKFHLPASAFTAHPSVPPAFTTQLGTNIPYNSWDFDASGVEAIFCTFSLGSSWDLGPISCVPIWGAASGSGDVVWSFNCIARSNDDAIAGSFSTTVSSTDTLLSAGDLHRGPESSALAVDGTPAANDELFFVVLRNATSGSDTLGVDAKLIGVDIFFTTNAAVDAP
jgi:hypothetical protein